MDYRLGLDLGTASVGAVALSLEKDGAGRYQPLDIIWRRAHIFSEPLEDKKGTLTPKAQDRRLARQQRRQLYRRKRLIKRVHLLAPLLGLSDSSLSAINSHVSLDNGVKVHRLAWLRAIAADQKIELYELMSVFARLAKRRGYSGGFRPKTDKEKKGPVESGANLLATSLKNKTLGQLLLQRLRDGLPTRLKINQQYGDEADLYALREHVEIEFNAIWDEQAKHHDILNTCANHPVSDEYVSLKTIFRDAIFYQRPLKPSDDKVGHCSLETNLPRAPKAQMAAQEFRIEQTLGNLRFGQRRHEEKLTLEQKQVIRELLNKQADVTFEKIYTALEKAGCPPPAGKRFSINRAQKDSLKGNATLAGFKALKLLDEWLALDETTQIQVINFWSELVAPEQVYETDWHKKYVTLSTRSKPAHEQKFRTFSNELVTFINKLKACKQFDRLSKVNHFEGGRAGYSIKALNTLVAAMKRYNCDESDAIRGSAEKDIPACYPNFDARKLSERQEYLPPPELTGNAVVDVALRQIRTVVNDCIDNLGCPPCEIIVEMSREIKNGVKARNEIESRNNKQARNKKRFADELAKLGAPPTPTNILKYELWEEQDTACPYCDNKIAPHQITDGSQTNFEHILPRSKTKVGRKRSEILLAHRQCNAIKSNRLPMIAFADDPTRRAAIEAMAKSLEKKRQRRKAQLLRLDDDQGLREDESVSGFGDWQNHDTSWIAKLAAQWLTSITERPQDVSVTRGGLTAYLRKTLGLETVIPQVRIENSQRIFTRDRQELSPDKFLEYKAYYEGHRWEGDENNFPPLLDKRIDHRHHIVDALAIALSSRSFVKQASDEYQKCCEEMKRKEGKIDRAKVMQLMRSASGGLLQDFQAREKTLAMIRSAHITHKPDRHIDGKFYQDGAYQRVFDPETDKLRLMIRKPLKSLVKKDADATRKELNKIISDRVRQQVQEQFDLRISQGDTPEEALSKPISQTWYGAEKPILNVKTWYDMSAEKAVPVPEHTPCKYLIPDYFAYMSLFLDEAGKVDTSRSGPVTLARARRYPEQPATNETRFYKGDTVLDTRNGNRLLIHKMKAVSGGTLFMAPLTETRNVDEIKSTEGKTSVSINGLIHYIPEG